MSTQTLKEKSPSSSSHGNRTVVIYTNKKEDSAAAAAAAAAAAEDYEKLAEDSFKAELDETVKLESDKILSTATVKEEFPPAGNGNETPVKMDAASAASTSSGSGSPAKILVVPASNNSAVIPPSSPPAAPPVGSPGKSGGTGNTASIMSQHGNKRLFKCGFCSTSFADTYKLERHVKSEHRDITDRAKYETFPWQEPGKNTTTDPPITLNPRNNPSGNRRNKSATNLYVDPSQPLTASLQQQHIKMNSPPAASQQNILSKLKLEPSTTNIVSSDYILCQVCSKIFASYKDFNNHMNESLTCKNHEGDAESCLGSNDVLVILNPDESLKFATGEILDAVVTDNGAHEIVPTTSGGGGVVTTPTVFYECHLCRAVFVTSDCLKRHLDVCQTAASNPKRRKT